MKLQTERDQVVVHCQKMAASGLSPGMSGNISVFSAPDQVVAISPSSMAYDEVTAADVVLIDLEGSVVDGRRRPSSELDMHLGCYRARQGLGAVVHTHSPRATTLAVLGLDLPAVHYMIALSGGARVRCAPYHLFGTPELAAAAVECMGDGYGCLLASHGVLAAGRDIGHAFALAEQIEFCAGIFLDARAVGEPTILSDAQIDAVIDRFESYTPQH